MKNKYEIISYISIQILLLSLHLNDLKMLVSTDTPP